MNEDSENTVFFDMLPGIFNREKYKSSVAKSLIEGRGASLLPLPPYGHDLNPIENAFAKLKSRLRKENVRDVAKLRDFLLQSGKFFSKAECKNYIRNAGYSVY